MMDWQTVIVLREDLLRFQARHDISDATLRAMLAQIVADL